MIEEIGNDKKNTKLYQHVRIRKRRTATDNVDNKK